MILVDLQKQGLIQPPPWLPMNTHYLALMGSVAYGVSSDTSDMDLYGFAFPPKEMVFPHLTGEILGFGNQIKRFEQWQQHHVKVELPNGSERNYDFSVFSIIKYFQLCMENNPNMVDSLFVPQNCVLHCTAVAQMVRDNRTIFLHKGSYHKFLGYAHSQLHKMSTKNPEPGSKRAALVEAHGFDTKFAYHLVRLSDECDQILTTGDLNLQRAKEHMKAVRRGEVTEEELRKWFAERERSLEQAYKDSKLPHTPDEAKIKALLLQCLEHHYGSLDKMGYVAPDAAMTALRAISEIAEKVLRNSAE